MCLLRGSIIHLAIYLFSFSIYNYHPLIKLSLFIHHLSFICLSISIYLSICKYYYESSFVNPSLFTFHCLSSLAFICKYLSYQSATLALSLHLCEMPLPFFSSHHQFRDISRIKGTLSFFSLYRLRKKILFYFFSLSVV